MVSPAGRRQDFQAQQVTNPDAKGIKHSKTALILQGILSRFLASLNEPMPVTEKSANVAAEVWNGCPPPSDLPPEFYGCPPPSDLPPELPSIEENCPTIECEEVYARRLVNEFHLELNSVGKFRVEILKNQGYIFNKELGICISEDGETIYDLDQLNKIEHPIETQTHETHRHFSSFRASIADVKNTDVDVKDPLDQQAKCDITWSTSSSDEDNN